jgi:hypothetical protein
LTVRVARGASEGRLSAFSIFPTTLHPPPTPLLFLSSTYFVEDYNLFATRSANEWLRFVQEMRRKAAFSHFSSAPASRFFTRPSNLPPKRPLDCAAARRRFGFPLGWQGERLRRELAGKAQPSLARSERTDTLLVTASAAPYMRWLALADPSYPLAGGMMQTPDAFRAASALAWVSRTLRDRRRARSSIRLVHRVILPDRRPA